MHRVAISIAVAIAVAVAALPAWSAPNYSRCVDKENPPECLARAALGGRLRDERSVLDAVVRHGLVDEVSSESKQLIAALGRRDGKITVFLQDMAEEHPRSRAAAMPESQRRKVSLAAIALLTAARRKPNPFLDPTARRLAKAAGNDPLIPVTALGVWSEYTKGVDVYDKWVELPGLLAIWKRVEQDMEAPYDVVNELAAITVFHHALVAELEPLFRSFAQRPDLTAAQKAKLAAQLADNYNLTDEAERLLSEGGKDAPEDDLAYARIIIALARLQAGYDAASARVVQAHIFAELATPRLPLRLMAGFDDVRLGPLERAGAKRELREIGDEMLKRAREYCCNVDVSMLFANASDCYLRAGDRARAVEIAREGLKRAPPLNPHVDDQARRSSYLAAALYRTGNIDEALDTKLLPATLRFMNAGRAGESAEPRWVIDDDWNEYVFWLVREAMKNPDTTARRKVLEALKDRCAKSQEAGCRLETDGLRAELAASLGEAAQMHSILSAAARAIDESRSRRAYAVDLAAYWAHSLEVLQATRSSANR
jgi:hypothetical protein